MLSFIKLKIPTDNPAIIPIEKKAPLKKDDSDIAGRNVKAAKIIKTIFAAMIDTNIDTETLNIPFEIILLFFLTSIENYILYFSHNAELRGRETITEKLCKRSNRTTQG